MPPTAPAEISQSLYLDSYLGVWAFEQTRFSRLIELSRSIDLAAHAAARSGFAAQHHAAREASSNSRIAGRTPRAEVTRQAVRNGYSYDVIDGVAILTAEGTLMKHASSYDDSTSTAMLRNSIRKMRVDPLVRGAILVIDSPGGTVSGAYDLAEDVEQLAKAKPVYAYGENLLCSAAYLQAAMTRGISINRNAIVGSIGTYCVVYDYSKLFENEGVKAIVIGSGGVKGAGVIGTEVTDEQIAEWQKEIDQLNGLFIQFVARGRKLSKQRVTELADGRVYVGDEAVKIGLVQRVETLDELITRTINETRSPGRVAAGGSNSSTKGNTMNPATIAELRQTFPNDPNFALQCAEQALTLQEAKAAYADKVLAGEPVGKQNKVGVKPVAEDPQGRRSSGGDAIAEFNDRLAAAMKAQPALARHQHATKIFSEDEDLRQRFVAEKNELRRRQ